MGFKGLLFALPFGGAGCTKATFFGPSIEGVVGVRTFGVRGVGSGIGLAGPRLFDGTVKGIKGLFDGGPPDLTSRAILPEGLDDEGVSVTGVLGI